MIRDVHPGSQIKKRIPDTAVKKTPDPRSATLRAVKSVFLEFCLLNIKHIPKYTQNTVEEKWNVWITFVFPFQLDGGNGPVFRGL
jgi:hypothetical protein